jgi:hypothetical protein
MFFKNSNETIVNQTRDIPTNSALPQPTVYYAKHHQHAGLNSLHYRIKHRSAQTEKV